MLANNKAENVKVTISIGNMSLFNSNYNKKCLLHLRSIFYYIWKLYYIWGQLLHLCVQQMLVPNIPVGPNRTETDLSIWGSFDFSPKFLESTQDYLFRRPAAPGNFPVERTKESRSIYQPTGISGNFFEMVNNQDNTFLSPGVERLRKRISWGV